MNLEEKFHFFWLIVKTFEGFCYKLIIFLICYNKNRKKNEYYIDNLTKVPLLLYLSYNILIKKYKVFIIS